ncbi:MAG: hypothetical protein ABFR89_13305, partial [Actinomycetota bacterium]
MTYASRILSAALVALLGVGAPALDSGRPAAEVAPAIVVGGTEKDHASVAWAVDQFDQMGLALPSVV